MVSLTAAIIVQTKELWDELQTALKPLAVRVLFEQTAIPDWGSLQARMTRTSPDVLLLDVACAGGDLTGEVERIRSLANAPQVVLLHTVADPDKILAGMRAGAVEYLYPPFADQLQVALERFCSRREQTRDTPRKGGKVIAFVSAKGGCGATTLACHVAAELPLHNKAKTLLMDLDMGSGIIGFLMKARSPYSVTDAAENLDKLDVSYWRGIVSNGIPDLEVLPAPVAPADKHMRAENMCQVLAFARTQYDWTVADLGRNLNASSLGVLDGVDETYLVTTAEIPALHQAKQMIQQLLEAGYSRSNLRLVLNRAPKRLDVSMVELEEMIGFPLFATIPNDYHALHEALAEGRLLQPGAQLNRAFAALVRKITGDTEAPARKRFGLFG